MQSQLWGPMRDDSGGPGSFLLIYILWLRGSTKYTHKKVKQKRISLEGFSLLCTFASKQKSQTKFWRAVSKIMLWGQWRHSYDTGIASAIAADEWRVYTKTDLATRPVLFSDRTYAVKSIGLASPYRPTSGYFQSRIRLRCYGVQP